MSTKTNQTERKTAGMGAIIHENGVAFRVWAPHADSVSVIGTFNDWDRNSLPMEQDENGHWYLDVENARAGDEYKFRLTNGDQEFDRIDPRAREVTNSIGNGVIVQCVFDWGSDNFELAPFNELVIYEMHVGTFHRPDENQVGSFADVEKKLEYLKWLGINAIELMPAAEFAGDISWGYNPAHIFAVESAYGGPDALKHLIKTAHEFGIGVILDVVYNHFGPSDLDLWRFDGWSENEKGGIYFYNDWRSETPWGDTRPDYGRGEVRQFIHDNAMMWVDEFRMDGLRYDMTLYMRSVDGSETGEIPEGWSLAQWINREIQERFPGKIIIAEDLRTNGAVTLDGESGGANFSSQWDEAFVHPIREAILAADDAHRNMEAVAAAITHRYNVDAFERVIYTESHDEVANGKKRVPSEIDENNPRSWFAKRKSTLGAALVLTAPGIPMLFQGQEFLRDDWFDDSNPIDWDEAGEADKTMRLYRDLINLRRNADNISSGLTGQGTEIIHCHQENNVIAMRRWLDGAEDSEVVVVMNFSNRHWGEYRIGFPQYGKWFLRLDTSSKDYDDEGRSDGVEYVEAVHAPHDRFQNSAGFALPPYSAIVFSQC